MRKIIEFFVNHSLFVNLLSGFLILAGLFAVMSIQREAFPNISYDIVMIRTEYLGSPPEEVEKLITIPLEDELKEVNGIDEMTSVSAENMSHILIQIDPDEKDKRKIVNDIQRAADRVDDLPEDAEDPEVTELQTKNMPILNVSISGDFDELQLQKYARRLEIELLDLQDVAAIERIGWRDREFWVEVDPKLVDEYKLSLEDVREALNQKNINLPGGTLHAREGDYLVRTIGEFETAKEVENVIIRANDLGNWIRISDVAEVIDTFEDDNLIEKTGGEKAITLTVLKKEEGDIIRLVKDVKTVAESFRETAPKNLKISYFDDFSYYVKRRLNVLKNNGIIGFFLVIICLLVFLSKRIAGMTALGIPVAFATTLYLMFWMNITINLISMFALIMVLGMIVDDAIIIAENVYRHIEKGKSPREAAIDGTREVALPVITTVLTTIVAFIPLLFMGGIIGKYISIMPLVVILALSASLFESLVILPSHLADFAKAPPATGVKRKEGWFEKTRAVYVRFMEKVIGQKARIGRFRIGYRYIAFGIFLGVALITIVFFSHFMKFVLFPQGLIEEFYIRAKAPVSTSLEEMNRRVSFIEKYIGQLPESELENFVTQVGRQQESVDDPYSERGTYLAQLLVYLTPEQTPGRRSSDAIINDLRNKVKPYEHLFEELIFEKQRAGPPVGKPVSIRLRGDEMDVLEKAAEMVKAKLRTIDGLRDIRDDYDEGKTELRIVVDEQKASQAYLTVRDIAQSTRYALEGAMATKIRKTDEEIEVIVRYPKSTRSSEDIFNFVQVPNRLGNLVPLNKVSTLEKTSGVHSLKHYDRKRMINVTSELDEDKVTALDVEKIMQKYYKNEMAAKFPNVNFSFGGEQEKTQESLQDLFGAMLSALGFIFIILAANFNSILRPLIVMSAIPFGLIGVIYTFYFHGMPLSFMAILGVIGLSGVVVNDSIVLVDFIYSLRKQGMGRFESILEACSLRLRPVFLTTVTTVFGLLPVAYGLGGNDPFLKPMALAVAYGILFATVLTLLMVPCLYAIADDAVAAVKKGWKKIPALKTHTSGS